MKIASCLVALCLLVVAPAVAQESVFPDDLLDRLAGNWLMQGTIGGEEVNHDVVAEWVLERGYLQLYELAREKDDRGKPAYEAIITIGWDEPSRRYVCQWLDSTGGGGLTGPLGYAEPGDDELAWVFDAPGMLIHNTFTYNRDSDTWDWAIDTGTAADNLTQFRPGHAHPAIAVHETDL